MPDSFYVNKFPKTKKYVLLYFHVHQPWRLNMYYSPFDVTSQNQYFGGPQGKDNHTIIRRVAERNYLAAGNLFLDLIKTKSLKISYSFTGTVLEQLQQFAPEVLELYRQIFATGSMELVGETYYHSLSAFYDIHEFARQVTKHSEKLELLFGKKPVVFRNTELAYRDDVGEMVRRLGFKAIFAEGWDKILDWRSANFMYRTQNIELDPEVNKVFEQTTVEKHPELKLLLKNYPRSDDIAFRFQLKGWEGYPVTADKFAAWIAKEPGYLINLCMDYETVGEHHRAESGILEFYRHLPEELAKKGIEFILPTEAVEAFGAEETLSYPEIVSWADAERDLSAWSGNTMQLKALEAAYRIRPEVEAKLSQLNDETEKEQILSVWGKLQTSDHFYYMSTKYWSDGDVHRYFSPYETPYHAYITFLNVLSDFRKQLGNA